MYIMQSSFIQVYCIKLLHCISYKFKLLHWNWLPSLPTERKSLFLAAEAQFVLRSRRAKITPFFSPLKKKVKAEFAVVVGPKSEQLLANAQESRL